MKPFVCERLSCGNRFRLTGSIYELTSPSTMARNHIKQDVSRPSLLILSSTHWSLLVSEADCLEAPPAMCSYMCRSCIARYKAFYMWLYKSFNTNQHLLTHQKIHDGACKHLNFRSCIFNRSTLQIIAILAFILTIQMAQMGPGCFFSPRSALQSQPSFGCNG